MWRRVALAETGTRNEEGDNIKKNSIPFDSLALLISLKFPF